MKSVADIYKSVFLQVWLLILSALVFSSGVWMAVDLQNYKYCITEGFGASKSLLVDDDNVPYCRVSIHAEAELLYTYKHGAVFVSVPVPASGRYQVVRAEFRLDIYEAQNGVSVLAETISGNTYEKDIYDLDYAKGLQIVPRLENVKISFPAWRIYVPVLLFAGSVPIAVLSLYCIASRLAEKIRQKRESETAIED